MKARREQTNNWKLGASLCASLALLFLVSAGCVSVRKAGREAENPEILVNSNFWHFYRRAVSRMKAGQWSNAAEDLERCLGKRGGAKFAYPFDRWRVRTYGLHVTEHYFPHREWGICLFELGRYDEALDALLTSINQEPSARAKHYVNRVRSVLVRGVELPEPSIAFADEVMYSRTGLVEIGGTASGPAYISEIHIGDWSQRMELAEVSVPFGHRLILPDGRHELVIKAVDLKARSSERVLTIVVDSVSPQVQFSEPVREGNAWRLRGVCVDAFGLRSVALEADFLLAAGNPETQRVPLDILLPDGDEKTMHATDWAGNTITANLRHDVLPRLLAVRGDALRSAAWATAAPELPAPAPAAPPPPRITLDGIYDLNVTYEDRFYVSGTVDSSSGLTALTVSGTNILASAETRNNLTRFGVFVPVPDGTSEIVVSVLSDDKKESAVSVSVERRKPEFTLPALRLAATLPPLVNAHLLEGLFPGQETLLRSFVERAPPFEPRFQVLARGDDLLAVLDELRLSLSDLVDERARVPLKRIATSDLFLSGEVLEDAGGLTLRLHAVETETSRWLGADDVYLPAGDAGADIFLQGLAAKAERRFPVVRGQIGKAGGSRVDLPAGSMQGLTTGARLLLIRPGEDGTHTSGRLLRAAGEPVQVVVTQVEASRATGRLIGRPDNQPVQTGDWFYSR